VAESESWRNGNIEEINSHFYAMKYVLGIGVFAVLVYWSLTTKNEVVESLVYPLKAKLGLVPENNIVPPDIITGIIK